MAKTSDTKAHILYCIFLTAFIFNANASFLISKKEKTLFSFNLNEKATYVLKSSDSLITTNTQYKKPYIFNKTLFAAQSLQGAVSTLAGTAYGYADGTGTAAKFQYPQGLATDPSGNIYVVDFSNRRIRKITPAGVVTTFAGSGVSGNADGTGVAATFTTPVDIAIDPAGLNLYVVDFGGKRVRKIVIATQVVSTIAGNDTTGNTDGIGTAATFKTLTGVAVDATYIYVTDGGNHNIRRIEISSNTVTTLAGSNAASPSAGFSDATGTSAAFNNPWGIEVDGSGGLYVAEFGGHRVRHITSGGVVTTLAGDTSNGTTGLTGTTDATGTAARFNGPTGIAIDSYGDLFVADASNNLIRKVTTGGVVTTFAGQGSDGFTNANGTGAQFTFPIRIEIDASDNFYIADYLDTGNHLIRKMNTSSIVTTTAASSIANKSVTLAGNAVEVVDGQTITARGIVYSITATNSNPTIGGTGVSQVTKGSGTGTFSENVTGLTANTAYTYRAYVTDSKQGTSYGPIQTFTTLKTTNSFSGASGSWSTDGNWSEGTAPTSEQHVSIPTGKTVTVDVSNASVSNLSVVGTLTIDPGKSITVNGNLTNTGTVTINSDATSSGSLIVSGSSSGNIVYNRYVTGSKWHLVGAPVSGESISDIRANGSLANGNSGNLGFASYDNSFTGTTGWQYITAASSGTINAGVGYSIQRTADGTVPFTGTLKVDNLSSYSITEGTKNAWNLVSNPYPSFIAANNGANGTNNFLLTNSAQLDPSFASLYFWNSSTNTYSPINHASASTHVSPGQAFFVKAKTGGGSINITEAMQSHQTGNLFLKQNTTNRPEIKLHITDGSTTKSTEIKYIEGTTTGLDVGYDTGLFDAVGSSFSLFTHLVTDSNGVNFTLQCLPQNNYENMVIPIGLKATKGKEITFSLDKINFNDYKIYLEDKLKGTFTQLDKTNTNYKITLNEDTNTIGRFYLHTTQATLNVKDVNSLKVKVFISEDKTIHLIGLHTEKIRIEVFDILGKKVLNRTLNNSYKTQLPNTLKSGTYILNIQSNNNVWRKKIILFNN